MGWLNIPPCRQWLVGRALTYDVFPTLVFPLLIIGGISALPAISGKRMWPRQFFYHAYAAHLTVLGVLAVFPHIL